MIEPATRATREKMRQAAQRRCADPAERDKMRAAAQARHAPKKSHVRRPCLCCRTPFFSEGPHNRLCNHCRHNSVVGIMYV